MRKLLLPLIRLICAFSAAAALLGGAAQPAYAAGAVITVTTTADESGGGSGCSLREAVYAANNDRFYGGCAYSGTKPDTILLPAGEYLLDRPQGVDDPSTGDLDITSKLTLVGASASSTIIRAGAALNDRVLQITGAVAVTIKDLTISGGRVSNGVGGGGILNYGGSLTLLNVTLSNNESYVSDLVPDPVGGAITNNSGSTLALTNATLSNNTAGGYGGGIYNGGTLYITGVLFNDNSAGKAGGAIYNNAPLAPRASIVRTIFDHNTSTQPEYGGAAIFNTSQLTLSAVVVRGSVGIGLINSGVMSLLASHVTAGSAAGVKNASGLPVLTVENSTLAGNAGPGLDNAGTLLLRNATIADNAGSGVLLSGGDAALENNLLTRNAAGSCQMVAEASFISNGYNILDTRAAAENLECPFADGEIGDPLLDAAPADHGGYTLTYAFSEHPESPAIDRVPAADYNCPAFDQRFFSRPVEGDGAGAANCDAGAFESGGRTLSLFTPFIGGR